MGAIRKYAVWLWKNSAGVRGALAANVLLGITHVVLNLYFIFICKRIVDVATGDYVTGQRGKMLLAWAIVMAVVILVRLVVGAMNTRLEALTSSKMNFLIRKRVYSMLLLSQWQGREKFHSGDTLNRMMTDVDTVTRIICSDSPALITTLFQLVAAFFFLCTMDWRLASVIVLITPVFLGLSKVFARKMRTLTKDIRESESKVQSHIQESIQHKTLIQSLQKNDLMEGQLDDIQAVEYGQVMRRANFNVVARLIVGATFSFGYMAAFLWGATGIFRGTITFGVMTAFLQLVGQIQNPTMRLTRQIPSFIYATSSIDRIMELSDAPMEERGEDIMLSGVGGVSISGMTFRYPDGEGNVLEDITYDFPPHSRTAVVGETGVGKSTMIKLMLSLLRPTSGSISIYDGDSSVEVSPMTRANFAYVPQGNTLFSGTIRENLLLGNPDATEEMLWDVLGTAAADFVKDLPGGLDASCGEHGTGLSEGQAQRIAIARGLLRPGSILLLDEFSSSLDPETEALLMRRLMSVSDNKTLIFITHREKIAEYCDRVLSLKGNRQA